VIEKYTIKLNNKAVGESFIVWMFVKTKPAVQISKSVLVDKHIKEVFGITGEYDLLMKLKFLDVANFNDFIIKFRKEQEVENTHTMVATATIKEEI
jgi:DNA-binding Lrp family transcriptional regulator